MLVLGPRLNCCCRVSSLAISTPEKKQRNGRWGKGASVSVPVRQQQLRAVRGSDQKGKGLNKRPALDSRRPAAANHKDQSLGGGGGGGGVGALICLPKRRPCYGNPSLRSCTRECGERLM